MSTFFIAMLIPAAIGFVAALVHLPARERPRASIRRAGRPGATRAEVGHHPSRGEPSAHAVPTVPPATDGPGIKRVL